MKIQRVIAFVSGCAVVLAGVLLVGAPDVRASEQRTVKVLAIGNKKYFNLEDKDLNFSINDVAGFAEGLQRIAPNTLFLQGGQSSDTHGGNQKVHKNQGVKGIRKLWRRHLSTLKSGDTSVFVFSGHGLEIEGQSYLLPSDVSREAFRNTASLNKAAVSMRELLNEFQVSLLEKEDVVGIFIVDACRKSLLLPERATNDAQIHGGMVLPHAPADTVVLYSAASRQYALETLSAEDRAQNSVFFRHLIATLGNDGLLSEPIERIAKRLRWVVYQKVNREARPRQTQTPAYVDEMLVHRNILGAWLTDPAELPAPVVSPVTLANASAPAGQVTKSLGLPTIIKDCDQCPELVELPEGQFQIGSAQSDPSGTPSERPQTMISIAANIAIGRFEVSRGEWLACQTTKVKTGGEDVSCREVVDKSETGRQLRQPITGVTWDDVGVYIRWLNGLVKDEKFARYRLPSEAEWEYAARAGSTSRYSFGNNEADLCKYANGADAGLNAFFWSNRECRDGHGRVLAQIDSYLPNDFGVHNAHGNVWEWTQDCWADTHDGIAKDGKPRMQDGCNKRVVRGGSWRSGPLALRSAKRIGFSAQHARHTLGFRIALDTTPRRRLGPTD